MKALLCVLVMLCASVASAQYIPIEQSRSYWAVGRYSGPVYPSWESGYGYGYAPYHYYAPMYYQRPIVRLHYQDVWMLRRGR